MMKTKFGRWPVGVTGCIAAWMLAFWRAGA
jgi:hypothetical protein